MPSLGFGEIIIILLVALIVFGPRKLPEIGRAVGKSVREFRRATSSLKADFEEGIDVDDDEPPTVPSSWQRRQDVRRSANATAPADPAETAPDDAASVPGPDPSTREDPD